MAVGLGFVFAQITPALSQTQQQQFGPRANKTGQQPPAGQHSPTIEVRATVELAPDPDKALLPVFADRYGVPVEVLQQAGGNRVVATLNPVRVVVNG